MIRHLVFLEFADTVTSNEKEALMRDLADLRNEIDGFEAFCARPNVSPETSLTHKTSEMFWIDFRDASARDAYLANETHKAIGAKLLNSLEGGAQGIFVCDIEL